MSIASSSYKPKSFEESSDLQDLRQQVKVLIHQNKVLTLQLEELIEVNNELTSSIEEYSKLHEEKFGPIDQMQLEDLANQVNQLQRELQDEREKTYHMMIKNTQDTKGQAKKSGQHSRNSSNEMPEQPDFDIDQIYEVIKELTNNIHYLQQDFYREIQNLQSQFQRQQQEHEQVMREMEEKLVHFQELSKQLIEEMHSRDQVISNLNRELQIHRNKKSQIQKQMKISLTIQDLKNTLEKKIQEKEHIIKSYESLVGRLRDKFTDMPI